jgi:CDP-glucose 4,6-dehydratase
MDAAKGTHPCVSLPAGGFSCENMRIMNINSDFWYGKCVLVTGHTGFMGGWLTVLLKEFGARVVGYSLAPPTTPSFFDSVGLSELLEDDVRGDVRDLTKLSNVVLAHTPEIVFHLAAQPLVREAFRRPAETFDVNVMGTVNVLEAARHAASVRGIVVITTDKVYENLELDWEFQENDRLGGREPYGVSKACCELVVDAYRLSFLAPNNVGVATVRAGNIIGGGDWAAERLVPDIVRAFSAGLTLAIRNPEATRPWQHVLEPLRGSLILAEALCDDPVHFAGGWNFGAAPEDQRPVSRIVDYCARRWGEGARWKAESGTQVYEAQRLGLTSSKAEIQLGWKPVWRLDTALDRTLDWYRAMIAGRDMMKYTRAQMHEVIPAETEGLLLKSAE